MFAVIFDKLFENFTTEQFLDFLLAYDAYIYAACDSGILDTGWRPVGVAEFAENEYKNEWDSDLMDDSFNYMYRDGV